MKRWGVALVVLVVGGFALAAAGPDPVIELAALEVIDAGEAWALDIVVSGAETGQTVEALLLHGLRQYSTTLTLGSGGVARWAFPAGELVAAGDSLVIVRAGTLEARRGLTVLPAAPQTLELLTTANALVAYGEQRGMVIAVAADAWGNPASGETPVRLVVSYPDGRQQVRMLALQSGLGWAWLASNGLPGRLRAGASLVRANADLEIMQMPGPAGHIDLTLNPPCLSSTDGRDIVTLQATVVDAYGSPVVDGTRVTFYWGSQNTGAAPAVAGRAVLAVPAPGELGEVAYAAVAGRAEGRATLTITAGVCP